MIAPKLFLLVSVFSKLISVDANTLGSACLIKSNNSPGVCTIIKDCPSIWDLYQRGTIRSNPPTVCTVADRSVCCPRSEITTTTTTTVKPTTTTTTTTEAPKKIRISEKKCREYAQYVYTTVKVPSQMFGEPPTMKKIDKCMYKAVSLIVGGEAVKEGEFPHMALLGYADGEPQDYACGGSLVSPQFVLTAAHCLYPKGLGPVKFVKLGNTFREQYDNNSFTFNVAEIIQHPDYDKSKLNNDLGVLKLDKLVPLSERILPICLPQQLLTPQKAIASGFGKTGYGESAAEEMLKVTLEKFTQEECQQPFGKTVTITNDSMICYGHHTEQKDSCNGDSGGPLQIYNRDPYCTYTQIGIVSFGLKKCGTIGTAGAYASVFYYRDWIEGVVWRGEN